MSIKPDYKDPHIETTATVDAVKIHQQQLKKIQTFLDENISNGWTLVYYDRFTNALVVTNGGSNVEKVDYAIYKIVESSIKTAFKK